MKNNLHKFKFTLPVIKYLWDPWGLSSVSAKKRSLHLGLLLFTFFSVHAQPVYNWTKTSVGTLDSSSSNNFEAITVDNQGNVYTTGEAKDSLSQGGTNIITSKYSPGGALIWSKRYYGGMGDAKGLVICLDKAGNVYISGTTQEANGLFCVTIKYLANGSLGWSQLYLGDLSGRYTQPNTIAVGPDGWVYVGGQTDITYGIGASAIGLMILFYNPAGVRQRVYRHATYGGGGIQNVGGSIQKIVVAPSGNMYASGYVTALSGTNSNTESPTYKFYHTDSIWGKWQINLVQVNIFNMAMDDNENIFINESISNGTGNGHASVAYDSSGNFILFYFNNPPIGEVGIVARGNQNVYLAGNVSVPAFSPHRNKIEFTSYLNGVSQPNQLYDSSTTSNHSVLAMAADSAGNIYLGGSFTNVSQTGLEIIKYNALSHRQWVLDDPAQAGISGFNSLKVDSAGNNFYYTSVSNSGVLIKYGIALPDILISPSSTGLCRGDSISLNYHTQAFHATGTFSVQLSNSAGSFTSPTVLETLPADSIGSTTITIPVNTPPGSSYRLRITDSTAAVFGNSIHIQIGAPDTINSNVSVCQGGFYIFNSDTLRNAGTYNASYTGSLGCDSTVILTLTVNGNPAVHITASAGAICAGETDTLQATGGLNYNWSNSLGSNSQQIVSPSATTTYTVTATDANGCSASTSQTVTFNPIPTAGITGTVTGCGSVSLTATGGASYAWSGGATPNAAANTFTSSGTYMVTVSNGGCTATASQAVTVYQLGASQFNHSTCAGETYNFNNQNLNTGGAYYDTLQTIHGCDSIVTLHLTVNNALQTSISDTTCKGIAYQFNGHGLLQAGVYRDTLQAASTGCDSIVTLSLLVDSVAIPTISRNGDTLQTQAFASYQWLRNGATVNGASTRTITIIQNGDYAVIVTNANGCSDTSASFNVTGVGIGEIESGYTVKLYPNPSTGSFTLVFSDNVERDVEITDAVGRTVIESSKVAGQQNFNLEQLSAGVYIVRINQQGQVQNLKFTLVR